MGILQSTAEVEKYFFNNWTETPIETPDLLIDSDSLADYISIRLFPTHNKSNGMSGSGCRIEYNSISQISCYSKTLKSALLLADNVNEFFKGKTLPLDIHSDIGNFKPYTQLDSFYEVVVIFDLSQYT